MASPAPPAATLATELRQALVLLGEVRAENEEYRANFGALRAEYLAARAQVEDLAGRLAAAEDAAAHATLAAEEMAGRWRTEIEEQAVRFEEQKRQILASDDMNLIRLRLVEEIEAPYREHIARLEASLEAEAGAFLGLRREHELLQTEAAAHRSEHRKVVAELERHHAAEIEQADLRAAALEDRLLAAQRGDARQALEGRLRQLKVRSDALAAELEDLRTGKAAAVSALLTENRRLQDEAANALDAARTQRSDASALSNRLQQTEATLAGARRELALQTKRAADAEREASHAVAELNEAEAKWEAKLAAAEAKAVEAERRRAGDCAALEKELAAARRSANQARADLAATAGEAQSLAVALDEVTSNNGTAVVNGLVLRKSAAATAAEFETLTRRYEDAQARAAQAAGRAETAEAASRRLACDLEAAQASAGQARDRERAAASRAETLATKVRLLEASLAKANADADHTRGPVLDALHTAESMWARQREALEGEVAVLTAKYAKLKDRYSRLAEVSRRERREHGRALAELEAVNDEYVAAMARQHAAGSPAAAGSHAVAAV